MYINRNADYVKYIQYATLSADNSKQSMYECNLRRMLHKNLCSLREG